MRHPGWKHELYAWLASHDGVVAAEQFRQWSCAPSTLSRMVDDGHLIAITRGVYRSAAHPTSERQLLLAGCLVNSQAVVGLTSACREWGMRGIPPSPATLLIPHTTHFDLPGARVHRTRALDPIDIVHRPGGLRVTTPIRSLHDAASMIGAQATASAVEQMLDERRFTLSMAHELIDRIGHLRRFGSPTFTRVVNSRSRHQAAAQSDLEYRVLSAIRRHSLPAPELQYWIATSAGQYRFDFAWPAARVALEVDHPAWHAGAAQAHRDKTRDRAVALLGWLTLRITDVDVDSDLARVMAEIKTIVGDRLRSTRG